MNSSYELLIFLEENRLLEESPHAWWPNEGTFQTVIEAIMTQNTKWENVQKSIKNLEGLCLLESFNDLPLDLLKEAIRPSGFYNQKAERLKRLTTAIIERFGDFESFYEEVRREWLLSQKGIGLESADTILCYACHREVMVVDKYTDRLLRSYGYTFESYEEIQSWLVSGVEENWEKIQERYESSLYLCYARFHGMIVEYMKRR